MTSSKASSRGVIVSCFVVALLASPAAARADDTEAASQQFHRGLELFRRREYEQARAAFELAYRTVPNPRVLANIAACLTQLGHTAEAIRMYRQYLAQGGTGVEADARGAAEREIERLSREVGQVLVAVEPAGAEVLVDGTSVGQAPLSGPVAVDPGDRTIEVRADGFVPFTRVVQATAGANLEVSVVLQRPASAHEPVAAPRVREPARTPAPPPPPAAGAPGRGPWPWLTLGTAVALGLGATATGLIALSGQREYEDPGTTVERRRELYGSTNTMAIVTDALIVGAAVAAATTLVLFLAGGPDDTDGDAPRLEATASGLRLSF